MRLYLASSFGQPRLGADRRLPILYGALAALTAIAWAWALFEFYDRPVLLGTALVAYGLGVRHAVDADHIAAIDNVTRKLMQAGDRPVTVGLWFAVGHSAVVLIAVMALALASAEAAERIGALRAIGEPLATTVSALVLFAVASSNAVALRAMLRHRNAGTLPQALPGGLVTRLIRPALRIVTRSWHMVAIGGLFGLGFETVTEMSLMGFSATRAAEGLSLSSVLVFPVLFAAGMALLDTTDGVLMLNIYERAMSDPRRSLSYNVVVTGLSIVVALAIGGVELLGLVADRFQLSGGMWDMVAMANDNFNMLGLAIVVVCVVVWLLLRFRFNATKVV